MVSEYSSTYDALAPRWDAWSSAIVPDLREEWTRKIEAFATPGERVVELGCGTGVPVGRFLAQRYDYTGIDASPGMLAEARVALPGANLVHADMHTVDFPPASLGAVIAFSSISHTPRDQHSELFAKIASWIRPRGAFIGNLHSRDDPDSYEPSWLGAGPMRWSGFDGATNLDLLTDAGFSVIESASPDLHEPEGETICPMWFAAVRGLNWLFRDRQTGEITIAQAPNAPLIIWLVATVINAIFDPAGVIGSALTIIGTGALIIWAGGQLLRGVNPFRRALGAGVLVWICVGFVTR